MFVKKSILFYCTYQFLSINSLVIGYLTLNESTKLYFFDTFLVLVPLATSLLSLGLTFSVFLLFFLISGF